MGFISTYFRIVIAKPLKDKFNNFYQTLLDLSESKKLKKNEYDNYPDFILYSEMPYTIPEQTYRGNNEKGTISLEFIRKYRTVDID